MSQNIISNARLGVVGYCPPTRFDESIALNYIREAYDRAAIDFSNRVVIVSGLTNVGVLKLAYGEAKLRGWNTAGIACKKALEFKDLWFPVDEPPIIFGDNWGDESLKFVESLDALIRIGSGKQSMKEAEMVRSLGKRTYEYDLPIL